MEMGHEIGYHYENLSEISKEKRVTRKENPQITQINADERQAGILRDVHKKVNNYLLSMGRIEGKADELISC